MLNNSKYLQIESFIKSEIEKNNFKIGDQILTEKQLCKKFSFSRMTVNKALNHLAEQGYIERIPGKGSFVTAPHVKKSTNVLASFTEDMQAIGLVAGSLLISYEVIQGKNNKKVANKLGLNDNDFIHYFVRLRTGNGKPIAVSYTYISAKIIPAIDIECLNNSFYKFVDSLGLSRVRTSFEIKAVLPTDEQKKLLKIQRAALLRSSHVTYTSDNNLLIPFEYIETYYNGDVYTYTNDHSKQ